MARVEGQNLCSKDPKAVAEELKAAREYVPTGVPIIFHTEDKKLAGDIERVSNGGLRRDHDNAMPGNAAVLTTGKGPMHKK